MLYRFCLRGENEALLSAGPPIVVCLGRGPIKCARCRHISCDKAAGWPRAIDRTRCIQAASAAVLVCKPTVTCKQVTVPGPWSHPVCELHAWSTTTIQQSAKSAAGQQAATTLLHHSLHACGGSGWDVAAIAADWQARRQSSGGIPGCIRHAAQVKGQTTALAIPTPTRLKTGIRRSEASQLMLQHVCRLAAL